MRTTSGLVLDVYDDESGGQLRELYPTREDIPATVKLAHVAAGEDRERLPDDVFALVLVNNGEKLRKYACIDEGNTVLSVEYFLKNARKLPVEAQKTAAANLAVACGWYNIDVPDELEKIAGIGSMVAGAVGKHVASDPIGTALTAMTLPSTIKGTTNQVRQNLATNRALTGGSGMPVTPQMKESLASVKTAEASGTDLMPVQGPGVLGTSPKSKTVVQKTATIGRLVPASKDDTGVEPDVAHPPTKEQKDHAPQAKQMHPTVDVSNKEPPKALVEKKASFFALPAKGKYPLDSYAQVKAASSYFAEYYKEFDPEVRHEYASNLVKRASALDIPLMDIARKYGSDDFAPEEEIKVAFDARRIEVKHNQDALSLLGEVEKVARFRMWKEAAAGVRSYSAEEVVGILAEFDKVAGLDHHYDRTILDPYYSIYGFEKVAEEDEADFSEVIGNETVTAADLLRLSRIAAASVKMTFGADFQEEFLKDPVGIFKSLPLAQKKMMMRLANSTQPGAERTYF